jgi:hypothetical protein
VLRDRLRQEAEESELVVVNHALFFADLVVRTGRGNGEGVLPRYEAVIFDEAHGLEDAATEFFGTTVSSNRFEELARDAQAALPLEDARAGVLSALAVKVRGEAEALWAAAPRAVGMTDEGTVRLTARAFAPLARQIEAVLEGLGALGGFASGNEEPDLGALARRAAELGAELDFVQRADAEDHVYWAEGRGRGLFLRAAPISVAEAMRERLYGTVDTVVFTSATLRTGSSFEYFCRQVGLLDAAGEAVAPLTQLAVPSSFDYASQSALYLPADLPEPREPGFAEAVAEEIARLVEVTGGRAFALFTSLRNMERVHSILSSRLPYPMLLQGEAPKPVLLDAFQSTPSVLFASASFWEGVDVPGDALSLVVLDKLPFAAPTHPVVAARIEALEKAGREPFSSYQLPRRRWRCGRDSGASSGPGPTGASWRSSTCASGGRPTAGSCWRACRRRGGSGKSGRSPSGSGTAVPERADEPAWKLSFGLLLGVALSCAGGGTGGREQSVGTSAPPTSPGAFEVRVSQFRNLGANGSISRSAQPRGAGVPTGPRATATWCSRRTARAVSSRSRSRGSRANPAAHDWTAASDGSWEPRSFIRRRLASEGERTSGCARPGSSARGEPAEPDEPSATARWESTTRAEP